MTASSPTPRRHFTTVEHRHVDLPDRVGVMFLVSQIVFPFGASQVAVRMRANLALLDSLGDDDVFAIGFAPGNDPGDVTPADLGNIGVAARVIARLKLPDGSEQVTLQGLQRLHFEDVTFESGWFTGSAACVLETPPEPRAADKRVRGILEHVRNLVGLDVGVQEEHLQVLQANVGDPGDFADLVAAMAGFDSDEQRRILECIDVGDRLELVHRFVREQVEFAQVRHETAALVQHDISKAQREYYLRRQMKVLREELGEKSREEEAADEALALLDKSDLPEAAERAVRAEIDRLRATNAASAEFAVIRNYVDWMLALPWRKSVDIGIDLDAVRKRLDADHYGLDEPKERILEFLAVRKLTAGAHAPILCFVGPPGTGKTSLAQSIAEATGRPLARIAVGGVRDESTIRGHRRTYVGAMPGRLIQAIRRAGCNNPVMVIDEVDKLGSGPQGDPSAALLEVLDREQNHAFTDHYLDVAFDLSRVLFITTANDLFEIPAPLQDRMEVIHLSTYVEEEKIEIAKRHLVPRASERTGLPHRVRFDVAALRLLVRLYTAEAGVRSLARKLEAVCRKLALRVATGQTAPKRVTASLVEELLGPPPLAETSRRRKDEIGVVNGLAWTRLGGDVLLVEAIRMPGDGGIQITGSLGDVMRESVQAALTWVRSRAEDLDIHPDDFADWDVHLHFPAGATPKDGPSAGVAICVALVSLYTRRPVRADVAMTGEVTLRGKVIPIGGLREKLSAAARLGIRHVIIPRDNERHLHRLRDSVRSKIEVHPVDQVDEALDLALRKRPRR